MNDAQEKWKFNYRDFVSSLVHGYDDIRARRKMDRYRREAALERALAAANRRIEEQAQRIAELEDQLDDALVEINSRDEREALRDKIEWGA